MGCIGGGLRGPGSRGEGASDVNIMNVMPQQRMLRMWAF